MAKKKAHSNKKLMPEKKVTVKSRAYGIHTRAARGSKTPVKLNDSFAEYNARTTAVNAVAKRVHDLLKVCSAGFKEKMLWQAMLSLMRKAMTDDVTKLLPALNGMELNPKYPLQRFARPFLLPVENREGKLVVRLKDIMRPRVKSKDTQYGYELFLLLLGKKTAADTIIQASTGWMGIEVASGEMVFTYTLPEKMKHYVLCLHFMTGNDGEATSTLASRGMRVAGAGKL